MRKIKLKTMTDETPLEAILRLEHEVETLKKENKLLKYENENQSKMIDNLDDNSVDSAFYKDIIKFIIT